MSETRFETVTAFATEQAIDYAGLYQSFMARESDASGTVVLHHGRVKRPGKQVPFFSSVELKAVCPDVDGWLAQLASRAKELFALNRALVVHRLGSLAAGETVLLVIVSSVSRGPAFEACSWIVDEIKKEEIIELVELP
jgi:molybdopterin synthase catalytic subunit